MTAPSRTTRSYTVVIRTYNRRDLVAEAIASVLGQTRAPEEVIVVDDGSSDGTAAHLRERFPSIVVVEQPNRGRSIAANYGIALARSEWVCLLDDDDLWHRDKLAAVDAYLDEHPEAAAVNHALWLFRTTADGPMDTVFGLPVDLVARGLDELHAAVADAERTPAGAGYLAICGDSYAQLLRRNAGAYSASVIRRDILIAAGALPASLNYGEDWSMFLNVARLAEWHTLDHRLAFYRIHDEQSTSSVTVDNVVAVLAAHIAVWYGGRPFPERRASSSRRAELAGYQREYRHLVQTTVWFAIRLRRWRVAREARWLGRALIVGRRNWLYVHLPPPLTHRLVRQDRLRVGGTDAER